MTKDKTIMFKSKTNKQQKPTTKSLKSKAIHKDALKTTTKQSIISPTSQTKTKTKTSSGLSLHNINTIDSNSIDSNSIDLNTILSNTNEKENKKLTNLVQPENITFWKQKFQTIFSEKVALEKELSKKTVQVNKLLEKLSKEDLKENKRLLKENKILLQKIENLEKGNLTEMNHSKHLKLALDEAIVQLEKLEKMEKKKVEKLGKNELGMEKEFVDLKSSLMEFSLLYKMSKDRIEVLEKELGSLKRENEIKKGVKKNKRLAKFYHEKNLNSLKNKKNIKDKKNVVEKKRKFVSKSSEFF